MSKFVLSSILVFGSCFLAAQHSLAKKSIQNISIVVTEKGFEPAEINVKAGSHVVLKVTRQTESTCANQIVIKDKNINIDLPLNKEVLVDLGTLRKGKVRFACSMDMISGFVIVK
jgi:plastocyanin domain-containing protein